MRPRLTITGPTGIGKTAYVDALMERFPLEAINMDSIQVYALFRIGPGRDDTRQRARRHLYGYLSPHDALDPASYVRSAIAVASEIELYGGIPMFEGGSRSLLPALLAAMPLKVFGLRPPPDREWRRARLAERVERAYFAGGQLPREVEAAERLGYGDCRLMQDPLVYLQVREHLAGRSTLEACKRSMVESMLEVQDAQLSVFDRMRDITWVEVEAGDPTPLTRLVEDWLREAGWLPDQAP